MSWLWLLVSQECAGNPKNLNTWQCEKHLIRTKGADWAADKRAATNTCPIDNHLTLFAELAARDPAFINLFDREGVNVINIFSFKWQGLLCLRYYNYILKFYSLPWFSHYFLDIVIKNRGNIIFNFDTGKKWFSIPQSCSQSKQGRLQSCSSNMGREYWKD